MQETTAITGGRCGRRRLAELLNELAANEGVTPASLPQVRFSRSSAPTPRRPIVYEPSIIFVAQGRKHVHLGGQVITYDAYNYLVLSVPLPVECATEATPEEPLLAFGVKVDPAVVAELLMEMEDDRPVEGTVRGLYATAMTPGLTDCAVRLLECLRSPMDSRVLGPQLLREITYRVLCGEQGGALRALVARNGHFSQIARVLRNLHETYQQDIDVESLAREANMSVSTFHHKFKAVTSTSPLQYVKSIRLHRARTLMVQEGLNASTAAYRVGYLSPSQFSREFKRFFGNSPADEAARMRVEA
ncbi:MAG: AraC family transcriptional regulator [Desulfovibrionaceae bacterium]|jgi:AraC-like DNA-binding protein|nr:AraC family transcriptional regulator [Desulfovibrionaceae bacterium]